MFSVSYSLYQAYTFNQWALKTPHLCHVHKRCVNKCRFSPKYAPRLVWVCTDLWKAFVWSFLPCTAEWLWKTWPNTDLPLFDLEAFTTHSVFFKPSHTQHFPECWYHPAPYCTTLWCGCEPLSAQQHQMEVILSSHLPFLFCKNKSCVIFEKGARRQKALKFELVLFITRTQNDLRAVFKGGLWITNNLNLKWNVAPCPQRVLWDTISRATKISLCVTGLLIADRDKKEMYFYIILEFCESFGIECFSCYFDIFVRVSVYVLMPVFFFV